MMMVIMMMMASKVLENKLGVDIAPASSNGMLRNGASRNRKQPLATMTMKVIAPNPEPRTHSSITQHPNTLKLHRTLIDRPLKNPLFEGSDPLGVRIRGTLRDIDPLNRVPFKRARSRVQKGYPLRGLPNTTYAQTRRVPRPLVASDLLSSAGAEPPVRRGSHEVLGSLGFRV